MNLCTSEHLLIHHPMLEGILLSECERLKQHSLANKLISLFRQFGGTELRLKLVWAARSYVSNWSGSAAGLT